MEYIYTRVSTEKQATENQLEGLLKLYPGAEIVEETVSGTSNDKPLLNALLARLSRGDTLVIAALDRLGRHQWKAVKLIEELHERGIKVVSVREGVDYSTASGRLMAQVILAFSENERNLISERTKAALAAKKAAGVKLGRPTVIGEPTITMIKALRAQGLTIQAISDSVKVSTCRVHQLLKRQA